MRVKTFSFIKSGSVTPLRKTTNVIQVIKINIYGR